MTKRRAAGTKSRRVPRREAILHLLKQHGPRDAEALASQLGISAMAVRQHLYGLRAQKLVSYQEQPRRVGRPAKMWALTPAAAPLFPDGHANLTLSLLSAAKQTIGEEGVKRIVRQCAQQQIEVYRSRLSPGASLQRRLKTLVSIRNEEGYMAEIEQQQDGSFLVIENHCAISTAANECPKLCGAELEVFQAILGENVAIERTEHMLLGARRCAYHIRPTSAGLCKQ